MLNPVLKQTFLSLDGRKLNQNNIIMSLKQLGNYKMESKSYGANREVRARKKLKKFRKKWLRKQPGYMVKYFKDYEY